MATKRKKDKTGGKVRPKRRRNGIDVQKFIVTYIQTLNATEAARVAGSSAKDLSTAGWEILRKPEVAAEVQRYHAEAAVKVGLSVEHTLLEFARLAYADIRKLYEADGTLKLPHQLDDDAAAAVAGFEVDELFEGAGKNREMIGFTRKAKLFDKNSALEKAMKYYGLYEKDNDQVANAVARIFKIPAKQRGGA